MTTALLDRGILDAHRHEDGRLRDRLSLESTLRRPVSFWEKKMRAPTLNSRERTAVYRRIFLLNRSFDLIVQRLDELVQTRIFNARDLREARSLTQEVQLEINTLLLNPLESLEQNDHAQFGKVRFAMEKRLRGE
jgi:hypothetical protein